MVMEENPVIERGRTLRYLGVLASLLLLLISYGLAEQFGGSGLVSLCGVFGANILVRIILFGEELWHLNSRCTRNTLHAFRRSFSTNIKAGVVCPVIVAMIFYFQPKFPLQIEAIPSLLSSCAFYILSYILKVDECPAFQAIQMREMEGLDYGSGMAHSFFHGYLKLILPIKGDKNKSLRERIEDFIADQGLTDWDFPVKKLIILIPSSGHTFPTLSDDPSLPSNYYEIEPVQQLEDHSRSRAGTASRVYRAGAYRLRLVSEGRESFVYTIAEGATPLLTFREAYTAGSAEAALLRCHKADVVSNFYRMLTKIIEEDFECRKLVKLLYVNDEHQSNPQNAVQVLKNYLIRKREKFLHELDERKS